MCFFILYFIFIKMNEIYKNAPDMENLEAKNALSESRREQEILEKDIMSAKSESTESIESWVKFPPTDSFWWIKLSKTATYSVPWVKERLKRTGKRRATNPTYENSLVMTKNGRKKHITHYETYYTDKDTYKSGKWKFPVENIEWIIRKILNEDRGRQWLEKIPNNQKIRNYGKDWTIRDMNWYIIVAADERQFPRWTLIMTTLWPGRVYDVWSKVNKNHIDIYTSWPV